MNSRRTPPARADRRAASRPTTPLPAAAAPVVAVSAALVVATASALAGEVLPSGPAAAPPPPEHAATLASLPPVLVADFTRRVQPLLLNRCAAGACHGGPQSPVPRFVRPDDRGGIDRRSTQANLRNFLAAVGPDGDATRLAALLAAGHPARPSSPRLVASPLSPQERMGLERWLGDVRRAGRPVVDPPVRQAAAEEPVPPPNRFRALLDDAADPPPLPIPEEPRGIIDFERVPTVPDSPPND